VNNKNDKMLASLTTPKDIELIWNEYQGKYEVILCFVCGVGNIEEKGALKISKFSDIRALNYRMKLICAM
jgi:hypothetical protein